MKPARAAIQLTKVWRAACPDGRVYPVNCRLLAEGLGLKVRGDASLGDEFEAGLFIEPGLKAILYNERIREVGRKNFSIAHELGHFSIHKDRKEIRCTIRDLTDMQPHPKNIEQEANCFAATLLMPADDFRKQLDGIEPSLAVISELAERYETTLTATCIRLIDLSPRRRVAIVRVRGSTVIGWSRSEEMRWTGFWLPREHEVPNAALIHDPRGQEVDSEIWLSAKNAPRWTLTQSSIYMPYYDQTLILLHAEPTIATEEWDEPDPTPPSMPTFR